MNVMQTCGGPTKGVDELMGLFVKLELGPDMTQNEKYLKHFCGIMQQATGVNGKSNARHHPLTGVILSVQLYCAVYSGMVHLHEDEVERFRQIAATCYDEDDAWDKYVSRIQGFLEEHEWAGVSDRLGPSAHRDQIVKLRESVKRYVMILPEGMEMVTALDNWMYQYAEKLVGEITLCPVRAIKAERSLTSFVALVVRLLATAGDDGSLLMTTQQNRSLRRDTYNKDLPEVVKSACPNKQYPSYKDGRVSPGHIDELNVKVRQIFLYVRTSWPMSGIDDELRKISAVSYNEFYAFMKGMLGHLESSRYT